LSYQSVNPVGFKFFYYEFLILASRRAGSLISTMITMIDNDNNMCLA